VYENLHCGRYQLELARAIVGKKATKIKNLQKIIKCFEEAATTAVAPDQVASDEKEFQSAYDKNYGFHFVHSLLGEKASDRSCSNNAEAILIEASNPIKKGIASYKRVKSYLDSRNQNVEIGIEQNLNY
jgi:hypothetical protein